MPRRNRTRHKRNRIRYKIANAKRKFNAGNYSVRINRVVVKGKVATIYLKVV